MAAEAVPADSGGKGNHLQNILIESELSKLPSDVLKKVNDYIDVKFEEYLTAKALLDASRNTTGDIIAKLQNDLLEITAKYEDSQTRLAAANETTTELERQLTELKNECNRLKDTSSRQESEIVTLKSARDAAVDERNDLTRALQRRDAELERLRSDEASLSAQLRSAIDAKCEAMANTDELQSKELSLQYRERRMEQERILLNSEIAGLTEEVNRLTNELKTVRLNNTSRLLTLESQLSEKIEELNVAENAITQLNETKNNLSSRAENLAQRLLDQRDMENKMCENYKKELDAKTKLADLYKGMQDDAEAKTAELTGGISELQKLLHEATEKYGELETKNKQMEMEHEEIIEKKNEIIASLKLELENANELLKAANNQNLDIALGELAPSAAAASKLLKSGMSLTQVYSQLVQLTDELAKEKKENKHLTMTISTVVRELEEKAPILRQQKMDYEEALENNAALSRQIDAMVMECNRLRDDYAESSKVANHHTRENARLKGELADLGRQVCFLLKEIEQSRGRSVPNGDQDSNNTSNTTNSSDLSSSRIISKTLVTFGDIQELQTNNQKLLRLVRDLTTKQEEYERNHEQMENGEMQAKMEALNNRVAELTDAQDRQTKMVNGLIRQRDMYKKLYHDNMKGRDVHEIPTTLERPDNATTNVTTAMDISNDGSPKTKSENQQLLETKLIETEKHLQLLKEEHKTYKEEKLTNEKMLFEQIDNMRKEIAKLTASNSKSSSMAEYNNERLKILQANVTTYKKQISSLEEKNKVYSETIAKHEMSIQHLRDETMAAQSKLARAEVSTENLRQECKLLKDTESRLQTEREMLNRERHGQALLLNNLEMIKASLERSETEGRMRLESRLDEATRECAAVRRRLQEEQDRFRELTAHLELQTQTAKSRMEEEKASADVLRTDLTKLKQDYDEKTLHNEELTKKLNMAMMPNKPDGTFDTVKKIKDLEHQLTESQALVQSLQEQLKVSKEHINQYCNISESAEKELKELSDTFTNYKNETEIKLANAQKAQQQLEDKCSELEAELSLQNNGQHTSNADLKFQLAKITEELQSTMKTLEETKAELDGAREEVTKLSQSVQLAEEKYAREMVLHSNDIQLLTQLKEEMSKLRLEMNNVKALKDQTLEKLEADQKSWLEREKLLQSEREELLSRLDNLNKQNSVLHDQIQALGTQLSIAHAPRQGETMNESGNEISMNVSLSEDDHKSSEQLFQIIKFLRKEKDIAVAKYDILQAEKARLKSQVEIIEKQLDETKLALAAEREKAEVNVVTIAKHSEILRKVETLNAITDSNRILREERDNLLSRVNELTSTTKKLEEELLPLQEKIGEITSKNDTLQSENASLKTETARWRTRVNSLVERANKTSPEDWKRLQNERETLAKMLTNEKENIRKLNEEMSAIKIEKTKLEEQCTNLMRQHATLSEDYKKQTEELNISKNDLTKITEELNKAKSAVNDKTDENVKVNELLASKELVLADIRNKEMQIRKIAKKYKAQYEELCKTVEEEKKKTDGEAVATGAAAAEELKAAEQRADNLQAQLDAAKTESEQLKGELETLRTANLDKEEKARHVLKQAKSKIVQLTEIKNSLNRELTESKTKIDSLEQSNRDEQDVRLAVLKSQYEGRLTRLEKERTEAQAERTREVDALLQKVNLLQRQLASQSSGTKQQASADKVVTDPPTANIKPLAAGAPQQSVCGQRRGGDTPLASIRPMAHAPDAHSTEYMPASSSRPHHMRAPHPAPAPPPASAPPESTQDMESEARPGSASASDTTAQQTVHSQPPQQAVALVLPRIEQPASGAVTTATTAVSAAAAEPGQLQAASSSGGGGVSTSGASAGAAADTRPAKRARTADARPTTASAKRTRVQGFERSVDVEYQVPTSSRCDQDDDGVIVVDSEEDDDNRCSGTAYQEGEAYTEEDDEEEEEGMEEGVEGEEEDETEEGLEEEEAEEEGSGGTAGGEGGDSEGGTLGEGTGEEAAPAGEEVSQESPAQSSAGEAGEAGEAIAAAPQADQHQQIEAISSGTEPITLSSGGSGGVASHPPGPSYEDGDDSIVPSTPTLYVPRRNDGFGEAVSSPVPGGGAGAGGRFTFGEAGGAGGMEDTHADLAAQLAPAPAAAPAGNGSGDVEQAEESSVGAGGEDDGAAVSSQGSQPASPHQIAEEGREAEASASPSRGSPRRRPFRPHHRPTPILWPNEMEGGRGGRGARGMRGRGVRRPFMRY